MQVQKNIYGTDRLTETANNSERKSLMPRFSGATLSRRNRWRSRSPSLGAVIRPRLHQFTSPLKMITALVSLLDLIAVSVS
jgi:hypothetical protein